MNMQPASHVFRDPSSVTWSRDVIGKLPATDTVVGLMGLCPIHDIALIQLTPDDQPLVDAIPLKADERIFRYVSAATLAGKMKPLVKVNIRSGLGYFLTEDAIANDQVAFETRGLKMAYLRLLDSL